MRKNVVILAKNLEQFLEFKSAQFEMTKQHLLYVNSLRQLKGLQGVESVLITLPSWWQNPCFDRDNGDFKRELARIFPEILKDFGSGV